MHDKYNHVWPLVRKGTGYMRIHKSNTSLSALDLVDYPLFDEDLNDIPKYMMPQQYVFC